MERSEKEEAQKALGIKPSKKKYSSIDWDELIESLPDNVPDVAAGVVINLEEDK